MLKAEIHAIGSVKGNGMNIRFGSPTFLFRHRCLTDIDGVLKDIAACGFDGLELYGMFGYEAKYIRARCDALGICIMGDHVAYEEFVGNTSEVIAARKILGTKYITIDRIPESLFPGNPGFDGALKRVESIGRQCREEGLQLLYHNHGTDLIVVFEGQSMLELLLDGTDPDLLKFQPDLGWLALGGGDPAYYMKKYQGRCPVVHLKDYFATGPLKLKSAFVLGAERGGPEYKHFEFRPTGYGVMNYPALMPLVLASDPEWIVADHDLSYERDTVQELGLSLAYTKKLVELY